MAGQYCLGIDAGGTFTDFLCLDTGPRPTLRVYKTLSTPAAPEQAILQGIRAMGLMPALAAGELQIVHGSTVATNATLEGKLAKTVFVSNKGFGDLLSLARQTRPRLYALEFAPIAPPVPREYCLETGGRLAADGAVLEPLTEADVEQLVQQISALQPAAVAINLLFSFLDDRFEVALEKALQKSAPALLISRSSKVLPVYKEYERGIATWLNAALGPVVSGYLSRLQAELSGTPLQIMQSNGETIAAEEAAHAAVHLLLSGPAGGLTAMRFLGRQITQEQIISFDMGGTSTDVALLDGAISTTTEGYIDRFPIGVPMVDMHTIGAGGGSIAYVDSGGLLQVGPRSAGASPGPACYGSGGQEATVTDANLVLGRLVADEELAGELVIDRTLAFQAVGRLAAKLDMTAEETALGIVNIANEHMAKAIRMMSVNRGYDPTQFLLASFGGAGGLHVCAIADAMQMQRAIVPAYGGVLSALGMLVADRGRQFSRTIGMEVSRIDPSELEAQFEELAQLGREELLREGLKASGMEVRRSADMRYRGQSYTLNVPFTKIADAVAEFHLLHGKRYGYSLSVTTELVNICVNVVYPQPPLVLPERPAAAACNIMRQGEVYGEEASAKIVQRAQLVPGQRVAGPAIVCEYAATTFVASGWTAQLDRWGNLLLSL